MSDKQLIVARRKFTAHPIRPAAGGND